MVLLTLLVVYVPMIFDVEVIRMKLASCTRISVQENQCLCARSYGTCHRCMVDRACGQQMCLILDNYNKL